MKTAETRNLISKMRNKDIEKKKEKLEYIGRAIPYGYLKNNKKLVIDKQTSHIVHLIYDLYDKGCSYSQIADYLNERSITSPSYYKICNRYINLTENDENKRWQRGAIRKILMNKVYNGYYKYSDKKTHPEIVDDELFNKVQLRIQSKQNSSGVDFYYHNGNIFSNKVYCEECGRVFTISPSNNKDGIVNYLRCSSYDTRGKNKVDCSNKIAIKYDELANILSLFLEDEIYSNINFKILENIYETHLKNGSIEIHRKYLKQEKILIENQIKELEKEKNNGKDLIAEIKEKETKKLLYIYNNRLNEIDSLLKEIYSFARTKNITKKEFYLDKYMIESFIEKITVGSLINSKREINIILK